MKIRIFRKWGYKEKNGREYENEVADIFIEKITEANTNIEICLYLLER